MGKPAHMGGAKIELVSFWFTFDLWIHERVFCRFLIFFRFVFSAFSQKLFLLDFRFSFIFKEDRVLRGEVDMIKIGGTCKS